MTPSRPLAQVLLRRIAIWYLLFAVSATGVQLYFEYRDIERGILRSLNALARTFAPGVAVALWEQQDDLLQSLAHSIGEHTLVVAVDIREVGGRSRAIHRAEASETVSENLSVQQPLYHRSNAGRSESLGTLSISSSETQIVDRLNSIALPFGVSILAQLLFLGGMLVVLARMLVVEPLTRFSAQVRQLVTGQEQQIDLGPVEIAEIITLQQGFNRLLRQVAESHAALEQRVAERTRSLDVRNWELAREHELTLALVRSIPGFVCVLDDAGLILLASHTASGLIGNPGTALALADHPLRDLFHQVRHTGCATTQVEFPNEVAGQQQTYQLEALRVWNSADAWIIIVGVNVTAQHEHKLRLQHLAFHDRLTGLPNRALLLERLERTLLTATRRHTQFAVAFLDLDLFKPINDSAGHEAGDAVLQEIADRLHQCVRESDTVARYGGDEFVLLLLDSHDQGLQRIAEAILDAVAQPIHWQGAAFQVSASMGFAVFPRDGGDVQALLDAADAAMYRAKEAGRNRADFG